MSRKTAVKNIGFVDDVDAEIAEIEAEEAKEKVTDLEDATV